MPTNYVFHIIVKIKHFIFLSVVCLFFAYSQPAELFIEAESFSDKGGWVVDQQFTDSMPRSRP